eukprot:5105959-Alexandrium_andersonii.AAC.1
MRAPSRSWATTSVSSDTQLRQGASGEPPCARSLRDPSAMLRRGGSACTGTQCGGGSTWRRTPGPPGRCSGLSSCGAPAVCT